MISPTWITEKNRGLYVNIQKIEYVTQIRIDVLLCLELLSSI